MFESSCRTTAAGAYSESSDLWNHWNISSIKIFCRGTQLKDRVPFVSVEGPAAAAVPLFAHTNDSAAPGALARPLRIMSGRQYAAALQLKLGEAGLSGALQADAFRTLLRYAEEVGGDLDVLYAVLDDVKRSASYLKRYNISFLLHRFGVQWHSVLSMQAVVMSDRALQPQPVANTLPSPPPPALPVGSTPPWTHLRTHTQAHSHSHTHSHTHTHTLPTQTWTAADP
jgi:hypothetical protein